jgi:mono/diheme cytochrome c family protein
LLGGKYALFTLGDGVQMREGERLMNQFACRRCHVSSGRGNLLAVNLDDSAARKSAEELVLAIRHPAAAMPKFDLNEDQITLLVNVIFAGSRSHHKVESAPVRVHFNTSGKKSADVFSTKCGSCHRLLSQRLGSVGTGEIGPNLSGLFSEFYPKNFKNGEAWGSRNLGIWRKNPREIRPWARMQPVELTEMETKELESIIQVTSETGK